MRLLLLLPLLFCGPLAAAPVTSLAFSPDGSMLASVAGGNLATRDPATGEIRESFPCEKIRLVSLAFAPQRAWLAVGGGIPGESGEVRLFDWHAKTWLCKQTIGGDLITRVAWSPDGQRLAAATMEKTVRIFKVGAENSPLTEALMLKGHSGPVTAVAFSPDGKIVVTTSLDRSLKVWSATDGVLIRTLGQHTEAVQCVAFRPASPDHPDAPPQCVTGSDDRTVRVWQPTIGRMVRIVRGHGGSVLALACAPDGRSLFSAGQEGVIRQIDAESDTVLREWRASTEWIHSLAISPDGKTLASGDWQGRVRLKTVVEP